MRSLTPILFVRRPHLSFVCFRRIFGGKRLSVTRLKDSTLLWALSAFLLVDVLINAVWMGVEGMPAKRVTVDPHRPALDYTTCDFSDGIGAVYVHIIVKGGMLLLGAMLAWAVRKTPSQFNESALIGLSTYNATVVVSFIVPLIAVELGGRETTYLVRAFAIMFLVLSTLALLYVPKLHLLLSSTSPAQRIAALEVTDTSAIQGTTGSVLESPSPGGKSSSPYTTPAGAAAAYVVSGGSSGIHAKKLSNNANSPPLQHRANVKSLSGGNKDHSKHRSHAPSSRGTPPSQLDVDDVSDAERVAAHHAHAPTPASGQGWANNSTPTLVHGESSEGVVSPTANGKRDREAEVIDEREAQAAQQAAPPGQVNIDMQ